MNVIDRLVLEIGIDPSQFTKGQREAMESLRKFEDDAEQQGKRIESQTRRLNDVLQNFKRETLGALGIFVGGYGLKELITNITNLDAATGRFAYTAGQSAQEVSAWQGVFKEVGGSAENANASIGGLTKDLQNFLATGQMASQQGLNALHINPFGDDGKLKKARDIWLEVAKAIEGMDPATAADRISRIAGANEDLINVLIKGRGAVEKMYDASLKAGAANAESAAKAQEFQKELSLLGTSATNAGRAIMDVLYPALTAIARVMHELIELSPGASGVAGIIGGLVGAKVAGNVVKGGIRRLFGRAAPAAVAEAIVPAVAIGALPMAAIAGGVLVATTKDAGESTEKERARRDQATEEAFRLEHPELLDGTNAASDWLYDRFGAAGAALRSKGQKKGAPTPAEIEAYIRRAARSRGMDPDIAVRVAKSEGMFAYNYSPSGQSFVPGEQSFGPFQLNYAKNGRSLGDAFTRKTGLDARDASTWTQQVDFSLDEARKGGWAPWHGWKGDAFAGIGAQAAAINRNGGAPGAAAGPNTTTVSIDTIEVKAPPEHDAAAWGKAISAAIDLQIHAGAANYGLK